MKILSKIKSVFSRKKAKKQSRAELFMELAGDVINGKSEWITIHEMRGKYERLIQNNGNTFVREVEKKYGYHVDTVYNFSKTFSDYHTNKAVMWRINGLA